MFANILWVGSLMGTEPLWWDSIRLIIQSQSSLAQSQSDLAMYGITVLIAIALLLGTASWFTNVYLFRREREREREEDFKKLSERIKDDIEKMEKKVAENVDTKIKLFDAEKARLFALSAQNGQVWESAATWWARAIKGYIEVYKDGLVRICVNNVIKNLGKCKTLKEDEKKEIEKHISFIPRILDAEKKQIEDMLDKLSKKSPESRKGRENIT